jgi:hypothetical protein
VLVLPVSLASANSGSLRPMPLVNIVSAAGESRCLRAAAALWIGARIPCGGAGRAEGTQRWLPEAHTEVGAAGGQWPSS